MTYYELFQQGPAVYVPVLLLSLVITIIAYGAFPFIFSKVRKNPITKKKYRRLCYGINAAVMFLFIVINGEASSGGAYVLWTWIFSNYGIKTLSRRGIITDGEYLKDDPNRITECKSCGYQNKDYFDACPKCGKYAKQYVYLNENSPADENQPENAPSFPDLDIDKMTPQEAAEYLFAEQLGEQYTPQKDTKPIKAQKNKFCSQCGSLIDNETKKCTGCGKQYFKGIKFTARSLAVTLLAIGLSLSVILNVVQLANMTDLNNNIEYWKNKADKLEDNVSDLRSDLLENKELVTFIDEFVVFVEDDGTDYYHKYECYKFKGNYFWAYNVDAAKEQGYTACPSCH